MASLSTYGRGKGRKSWRITFIVNNGKQRAIWLGRVPKETAISVKGYVDKLVAAKRLGVACDALTTAWLTTVDDATYEKLQGVGLVEVAPSAKTKVVRGSDNESRNDKDDDDDEGSPGDQVDPALLDPTLLSGMLRTYNGARLKESPRRALSLRHTHATCVRSSVARNRSLKLRKLTLTSGRNGCQ